MRPDGCMCYTKLICNKADNDRVVGYHVLSPNAGETTQGVGVAMKCGATKEMFDACVGIHPTTAEEMTTLN
jgi:pyruvate/2-oxoglutarate dehydrogenase complex dihydrolipoamide dehydrogenase (E3) component